MNEIAIWSKFKDYGDWCYQYRIPEVSEFIEGFEYEFAGFTKTQLKDNAIIPYKPIDYNIELWWHKYIVGEKSEQWKYKENKTVLANLKSYLEAGYIRVKKADEGKLVSNNQNQNMKLFYYEASKGLKKKYIVVEATNQMEGWNKILATVLSPQIKAGKFSPISNKSFDFINEVELDNEQGYKLTTGGYDLNKDAYQFITQNMSNVIVEFSSRKTFAKLSPNYKDIEKPEYKQSILKKSFKDKWVNKIKPNLKAFCNIFSKKSEIVPITVEIKPDERYLGKEKGYSPLIKPICHKPKKSPNRLVCIATKDKKYFHRLIWQQARILVESEYSKGVTNPYEYISREEYRKLTSIIPSRSFTPALGEIGYTSQDKTRDYPKYHGEQKYYKTITKITPFKDRTDLVELNGVKGINASVLYDGTNEKFTEFVPVSTDLIERKTIAIKGNRKSKRHHHQQGIKHPKQFYTFEVSFERYLKSGSYEFVYQVKAESEQVAINRATNRLLKESPDQEYTRRHGVVKLAHFKPVVKRSLESNSKVPLEKKSLTLLLKMPHVYDLPIRKNKKGEIIPWTKKITRLLTEEERKTDKSIFKQDVEEIKTYTKWEISYNRYDQSPFKKDPKKWKCPTSKDKNYNHPKKKIVVKRHCKNIEEKHLKYLQQKSVKYRTK